MCWLVRVKIKNLQSLKACCLGKNSNPVNVYMEKLNPLLFNITIFYHRTKYFKFLFWKNK